MHDPAVVTAGAGGLAGAGVAGRGVSPIDHFLLGVFGLAPRQHVSLWAAVLISRRVVGEFALAVERRPLVEIGEREERPDTGVLEGDDVLGRAVGGIASHLVWPELAPETDPPQQVAQRH